MNKTGLMFGSLLALALARAGENEPGKIAPGRVSFYAVPLACPAAPQIGCGSRSKPILLELEQQPAVAEAWLDRSGTRMAVVWKPEAKRKRRASALETVSKREGFSARELSGTVRKEALKDFLSGHGWFQSSDVDRLSEEEAGVVAARLVRRINATVPLSADKAEALRVEFRDVFKRRFTGASDTAEPDLETQLLTVIRSHLDEKDAAVLKETLPRNLRPLPGER